MKKIKVKKNPIWVEAKARAKRVAKMYENDEHKDFLRSKKTRELMISISYSSIETKREEDKKQERLKKKMIKAGTV